MGITRFYLVLPELYRYCIAANLTEANLQATYLWATDLDGACLKNADISGASLQDANLSGANLRDVILTRQLPFGRVHP